MNIYIYTMSRGRRGRDRMVVELPMLSVPTATDVESLNLDQGKVYNIML
jgi:hypothetical protein